MFSSRPNDHVLVWSCTRNCNQFYSAPSVEVDRFVERFGGANYFCRASHSGRRCRTGAPAYTGTTHERRRPEEAVVLEISNRQLMPYCRTSGECAWDHGLESRPYAYVR